MAAAVEMPELLLLSPEPLPEPPLTSVVEPPDEAVVQAASEAVVSVMTEPSERHCCVVETLLARACETCTSVVVVDEPKPHTLSG